MRASARRSAGTHSLWGPTRPRPLLSRQAEDLAADVVQLNGARTLLVTPEGRLPPLDAARVQGLAVTLPAHSAAFLQVHFGDDASHARLAAACSP